jgi:hypothetical protein
MLFCGQGAAAQWYKAFPRHQKVKGLSRSASAATMREKMAKMVVVDC